VTPFINHGPLGLPIGIQLYTVNAEMLADAPATLSQIASIGYAEVETAGLGTAASPRELRKQLDDLGLRCPSAHLQFELGDLSKAFDEAHQLGCSYATTSVPRMLLWPPASSPYSMSQDEIAALIAKIFAPMPLDEYKRTAEALNKVGEAAKKAGLRFAAHNHTMEMDPIEGETGLDYLIKHTDAELVKFELDCGWATMTGNDPVAFIDRHPGRITLLHVKDFMPHQGAEPPAFTNVKGMELGRGIMDYPAIFSRIKGKGIEHIFVEQDGPFGRMPAIESARVDFEFLRSFSDQG
jgi:sugar phosphate isomerase/epimerase